MNYCHHGGVSLVTRVRARRATFGRRGQRRPVNSRMTANSRSSGTCRSMWTRPGSFGAASSGSIQDNDITAMRSPSRCLYDLSMWLIVPLRVQQLAMFFLRMFMACANSASSTLGDPLFRMNHLIRAPGTSTNRPENPVSYRARGNAATLAIFRGSMPPRSLLYPPQTLIGGSSNQTAKTTRRHSHTGMYSGVPSGSLESRTMTYPRAPATSTQPS